MLIRFALTLMGWLPLPLLHALGAAIGALLWVLPNKQKRITLQHLQLCFPEKSASEQRRIARASLKHMGKAALEAPAIWFGPEFRLRRWLRDDAAAAELRAITRKRAAILLCPHIGSWELTGMFCAANGPITTLYKPQKGVIDQLILAGRSRLGAKLVPTEGSGVRALLHALKQNEMIGVLPDHDPPEGSGEFAPLFGVAAHTPSLITKLAGRTGAAAWFCYAERLSWGRGFRIHLKPAAAAIGEPTQGVAALNRGVEQVLRHLPEQYWWSYPRYRRRPQGEAPIYGS